MSDACLICRGTTVRERGIHPKRGPLMEMIGCHACGRYFYSMPEARDVIIGLEDDRRFALAAATRQASDAGAPLELLTDNLQDIIDGAWPAISLSDRVERLLLLLAKRATAFFGPIPFNKDHDFALLFARGARGTNELMVAAMKLGYLEEKPNELRLTVKGWERIDVLRGAQTDSRQAFVAMWFDPDLNGAWERGLKAGIERSRYFRALRIDAVEHNEKIDDRIVAEIRRSGLVVADFTGQRPGVYYEAGLARGLGITVISTCRDDETGKLHFDTRQYNHIVWKGPADLADQLHDRIAATALPKGWVAPG